MTQVTMREWVVLTFVRNYWQEYGVAPSRREIMDACGLGSTSVANYILRDLEAAGVVRIGEASSNRTVVPCDVTAGVMP